MEIILNDLLDKQILDKNYFENNFIDNKLEVIVKYKSLFENTKHLRDIIQNIMEASWIDKIWVNRFILIWDELNNNSIEYWSKSWDENTLLIIVFKWDDFINIDLSVSDRWNWDFSKTSFEMEKLRDEKRDYEFDYHKSIRWRGLFLIISNIVDSLEFLDNQDWWLTVKITKKLEIKKEVIQKEVIKNTTLE